MVATDSNTHKAQGGKRVIYTTHSPVWDAKNRHNLPEEMDLQYESIAPIFGDVKAARQSTPSARPVTEPNGQPAQTVPNTQPQSSPPSSRQALPPVSEETLSILNGWMDQAGIQADELQQLVAQKGHFPPETTIQQYPEKFVRGWVMHNWDQIVKTIYANPEHVPF